MLTGGKVIPAEIGETSRAGESRAILVVDDEERLRRALERSLCRGNWQTYAAASGEEALCLLKKKKIDLVVTDLSMPGMDGMALVRSIKRTVPSTKVIIITAYGSSESMQEAEALGVGCYLAKPFDLSYLKSRVNELLLAGKTSGPPCAESRCRGKVQGWQILCSAAGTALGTIACLFRVISRGIKPRTVMGAAGRV